MKIYILLEKHSRVFIDVYKHKDIAEQFRDLNNKMASESVLVKEKDKLNKHGFPLPEYIITEREI